MGVYGDLYTFGRREKERPEIDRDKVWRVFDDSTHPFQALSTDAQSLLDSEDQKWNRLVDNCEITKHSMRYCLPTICTVCIRSMPRFIYRQRQGDK